MQWLAILALVWIHVGLRRRPLDASAYATMSVLTGAVLLAWTLFGLKT